MTPDVPPDLLARAAEWHDLHRWERSELGKALRRLGLTYGEIREIIPVPKGTLSYWCSGIRLCDTQVAAIVARTGPESRVGIPVDTQRKRREEIEAIRAAAFRSVPQLQQDPRWMAGTVLYWAEGSKSKRSLELTNSDPEVLRVFIAWARTYHRPNARFSMALHLHEGNDEPAARRHWRSELELPDANFTKTFIKPKGTGHRKNQLPWGVCRVRMRRSVDAFVTTMAWIEALRGRLR